METFVLCFQRNFKTIGKVVYGINNGINSNNGYISNIKVDKLYRNKGIGTKLLKLSENHLRVYQSLGVGFIEQHHGVLVWQRSRSNQLEN